MADTPSGLYPITLKKALGADWFGAGLAASLRQHANFLLSRGVISNVSSDYDMSINPTYRATPK